MKAEGPPIDENSAHPVERTGGGVVGCRLVFLQKQFSDSLSQKLLSGKPPPPRMLIVEAVLVNLPRSDEEISVGSVRKREEYITILICPSHDRPLATALHAMRILLAESILVAGNGFPKAPHLAGITR